VARYHQAAMINGPMSNAAIMVPGIGLTGVHVHPKAKSNDMMMGPRFI
jgi:hypothetical protein